MTLDDDWYAADVADQRAEQTYHRLRDRYGSFIEFERVRTVSRPRFRTLADRIRETGAPFGTQTAVYRPSGELLLVRHDGVDMWVLPGGEVDPGESFRDAAERELGEEAGVEVDYEGLGFVTRMEIRCADHETWGILPVFAAAAETIEPEVSDPDGEIIDARWFDDLPEDTRDRDHIETWRERTLFA